MTICYSPYTAYFDDVGLITFKETLGIGAAFELPCGQCLGCRSEKRRQWAIRCTHEASLYEKNCFITLTYDDANLPKDQSLVFEHLQKFMKRLRKSLYPKKIKYFACGEYGDKYKRPHYHAIIFNHDFGLLDQAPTNVGQSLLSSMVKMNEGKRLNLIDSTDYGKVYNSEHLQKLWPFGFTSVAECSFLTCSYVAKYVTKKMTGPKQKDHYDGRLPDFGTMSKKEAIGKKWIEKYHTDVFPNNNVVLNERVMKIPAYYEKWYKENFPIEYEEFKQKREAAPRKSLTYKKKHDKLVIERQKFKTHSDDELDDINDYDNHIIDYYNRRQT